MDSSISERLRRKLDAKAVAALSAIALTATTGSCGAPDQETCEPHQVYAQGMWYPPGAIVREKPDRGARNVGSLGPNQPINVDYWFHSGKIAYENNKYPYKSDVWLHLVETSKPNEWVNYAAVRAKAVPAQDYDPKGLKPDVGGAVPLEDVCELKNIAPGASPTIPVVK
jgi:hypothetical protein